MKIAEVVGVENAQLEILEKFLKLEILEKFLKLYVTRAVHHFH